MSCPDAAVRAVGEQRLLHPLAAWKLFPRLPSHVTVQGLFLQHGMDLRAGCTQCIAMTLWPQRRARHEVDERGGRAAHGHHAVGRRGRAGVRAARAPALPCRRVQPRQGTPSRSVLVKGSLTLALSGPGAALPPGAAATRYAVLFVLLILHGPMSGPRYMVDCLPSLRCNSCCP